MKSRLILSLVLLLLFTGAALAQTPDGETPSTETVCDSETGAAFGLCNAYCEAMDCETDSPQASATACTKVRDKFLNITGRDLPCEAVVPACPCSAIPEWNAVLAGQTTECSVDESAVQVFTTTGSAAAFVGSQGNPPFCMVADTGIFLVITPEQAEACVNLLTPLCIIEPEW